MVKRQLVHLKTARLASVEHFKKRKLEQTQSLSAEQLRIDDNQLNTSDTGGASDIEDEDTWIWHEIANYLGSDTEDDRYSGEEESDLGPRRPRTEEEAAPQKPPREIHWNKRGEENLRGFYGNGSRATLKRKRNVAKALEKEVSKTRMEVTEATELFEYVKANEGYWDQPKPHKQVVNKALPISEALYPNYSLLFLLDNATTHAVYADNALCTAEMNKSSGGKQPWLRNRGFQTTFL